MVKLNPNPTRIGFGCVFVLCGGGREISAAAKSELQQTIDSLVC
jgi:hypothetical protein